MKFSPETFQKLEKKTTELGLPFYAIEHLKPWFATVLLQFHQIQNSVETASETNENLYYKAKKTERKIMILKSAEFQMNLFADLSEENQIAYLTYILDNPRHFKRLEEVIFAEENFNYKKNKDLIRKELSNFPVALYQNFVKKQNNYWLPQIKKILDKEEQALIILNPGHLQGEDGLIALLKKEGYKLKPQ